MGDDVLIFETAASESTLLLYRCVDKFISVWTSEPILTHNNDA